MSRYGMGNAELLRSATVEAARAMREEDEFGTVEAGKRADLLVLSANPLEDPANLKSIRGVVVRGIWLPRERLDNALAEIDRVYNAADVERWVDPHPEDLERLVERMTSLEEAGYVFKIHQLEYLHDLLEARGRDDLAAGIAALI